MTTDGFNAHASAVEGTFGGDVDFAQFVNKYGSEGGKSPEKKYRPPVCLGATKTPMTGWPNERHISTSYVERQNLNMRMGMRRFTRLTNAISKKIDNHCHPVALYFLYYNLVRIYKTLKMTPAMAAGVSDRLWSMEDAAALIDARAAKPGPRGPYKKSRSDDAHV